MESQKYPIKCIKCGEKPVRLRLMKESLYIVLCQNCMEQSHIQTELSEAVDEWNLKNKEEN